MRPVERNELLDYVTYEERRDAHRPKVLEIKSARRIIVADVLNFSFENRDTIRYQIQEMMRIEKIVKEADIVHELATYNELLGRDGELGCTLMIGLQDEAERAKKLRSWLALPEHVYVRNADGTKIRATYDPRQVGDDRLSSVQYMKFPVGTSAPVAVGTDLPALSAETELAPNQRAALQADLDAR